ncbi:MAG: ester cyclase, partial [Anaerolineales bacterium]
LETAEHFLATHNQANYREAFDEYLSPDCVVHEYLPGLPDAMPRAVYEQFIAGFRAALPDIHNQLEDAIADGDRVSLRWTGYGTHTGAELMQVPATGKSLAAHGIYILRFEAGKIAEVWNHWDSLSVAQQLRGG